jgi:hypothetical protein
MSVPICTVCLAAPWRCVCPYFHQRVLRVSDRWWRPKVDHSREYGDGWAVPTGGTRMDLSA